RAARGIGGDAEPRRDVQISFADATSTLRKEVQRRAIEGERRRTVEGRAVDVGSKVDRRRPGIERARACRYPDVLAADAAYATRPVGRKKHLEPVTTDGGAGIATGRGKFCD